MTVQVGWVKHLQMTTVLPVTGPAGILVPPVMDMGISEFGLMTDRTPYSAPT